jgi:TRAP-type C4-dicarboxylate transport system substrate-binding protein
MTDKNGLSIIAPMAAALLVSLAAPARADEPILLKFANPATPTDWVTTKGIDPWAKDIADATGGLVEIKNFAGGSIANFRNVYDRLLNGVAEFAFGTFGAIADQFPKTVVPSLPFLAENSAEAGLAQWRLYANGITTDEFAKVKPIAMFGFGISGLHLTKAINKLDDLKGMKVLANGRIPGQMLTLVGAVPVTSNPAELYQSLSRGVADGTVFTWSGIESFRLGELVKYHVDIPFGSAGGYFFMNKDSFAKLPEKAQAAIDRFSGEPLTKTLGAAADSVDAADRAKNMAQSGHTEKKLTPDETNRLRTVFKPILDEWVAATPDGARVLAAYRAEIERIRRAP